MPDLCGVVVEEMGDVYPELRSERETIARWAAAEEEGFGRTLAQGERLLADLIATAKAEGATEVPAEDAFRLHDTYGFPFEMTQEMLGRGGPERRRGGLRGADGAGARDRARSGEGRTAPTAWPSARRGSPATPASRRASWATRPPRRTPWCGRWSRENGTLLAKLEDSPFYPEGGGQVSDDGTVETASGRARVVGVFRLGADQALALEPLEGEIAPGDEVHAEVERDTRLATMRNHTATHLLHAALRERLGTHVRQAGSYVGPDKLRFDFTHGQRLSDEELADVEERVNGWIADNLAVRAIETTLDEARAARRDGAVRGEVRRLGADGGGGGRVARAVRRHARAHHAGRSACST